MTKNHPPLGWKAAQFPSLWMIWTPSEGSF
jgi:hypothetical protein